MRVILSGERFGRLTAKQFAGTVRSTPSSSKRSRWLCICDCGNEALFFSKYLKNGDTKSCGCLLPDVLVERNESHRMSGTPTYSSWAMMIQRCTNPKFQAFAEYGAVGITMDQSWFSFEKFYLDMGDRPDGTSLDRIRVEEGYSSGNCRWADDFIQARNRKSEFSNSNFGLRGVVWREDFKRYSAHIGVDRKQHHLGLFGDFFEACCARKSAEARLWGNLK